MKILIIEDEIALQDTIASYLAMGGHICEKASSFFQAEDKIISFDYDIIILDLILPDGNGLDLLKIIKEKQSQTGVLILSARNSLDDKLKGLNLGSDDYITKPFHLSELNARINAIIRRKKFNGNDRIMFHGISLNLAGKEVRINNHLLNLTKKEYDLLLFFITNKNRVVTKESIAEHLSGDFIYAADDFDFVYTHIKNLRKKIHDAGGTDYIKTVYGIGYKFSDT